MIKLSIPESSDWNTNTNDSKINLIRTVMYENNEYVGEPCVGIFWYDADNNELFGVRSTIADDTKYYKSEKSNQEVRTTKFLHYAVWQKECNKGHDARFKTMNYTNVPRGRVFQCDDGNFLVGVGSWVLNFPQVQDMILVEFNLPKDNTSFVISEHWE